MNLFSTDEYLESLAEVAFPGRRWAIEPVEQAGEIYRVLVLDRSQVISRWPFLDFLQPMPAPAPTATRGVAYLPRVVLQTTSAETPRPERPGEEIFPAPFIDWKQFPDWESFEALVTSRIGNLFPDSKRKKKKLERDLGPVSFVFDDPRPEVFDACIRWKSSQYLATGLTDMFADPPNVELFRELKRRGAVVVSSLSAGNTLLAVHLGGMADRRHYWWVPAYDPAHGKYSPGRLLLEAILRESHQRGHTEFDFLIGDEAYKWHYATHNRVIGPKGRAPLPQRLGKEAKRRIKGALEDYPRVMEAARSLRNKLRR